MAIKDISGSLSSLMKRFYDNFTRANQSPLGTSVTGTIWQSVRGSFSVSSNRASSGSDSSYPMSVIDARSNDVKISMANTYQGSTAALWVTDSGNWWAVGIDQDSSSPYSCSCQTCSAFNTVCNSYSTFCSGNYNASNCAVFGGAFCSGNYNTSNCIGSYYSPTNKRSACNQFSGSFCNSWSQTCFQYNGSFCNSFSTTCTAYGQGSEYFYSCNCQTCYPQYIRVIQSVSSTISQVASWSWNLLAGQAINSFTVSTKGKDISIQPYYNTDFTSELGSTLVHTPSNVAFSPKFGIAIKPSTYGQQYSNGPVEIIRN